MDLPREKKEVLKDIRQLVQSPGYIYPLCMMLFEDFHVDLINMHKADLHSRLSFKEAALLLGFLIQKKIDFTKPHSPNLVVQLINTTRNLLVELHDSYNIPHFEAMKEVFNSESKTLDFETVEKTYFGQGRFMEEPFFYSGTGVYDFQYLDFLEKKYKYDKDWLQKNRCFDIEVSKEIVVSMKSILAEKGKAVHLYFLRESIPDWIEKKKKENPDEDIESSIQDTIPMLQFHQYSDLFFFDESIVKNGSEEEKRKAGWNSFYDGLVDLFTISKTDFCTALDTTAFLNNFSIEPCESCNKEFNGPGDYNLINSHPVIKLSDDRYFVPNMFLVSEAVYESPFYWMIQDKRYKDQLGENRGKVGEQVTYDFLAPVFGESKIFKGVKIKASKFGTTSKKSKDVTDIDIFCVLGSKALCVQVKSKKLSLLARKGSDEHLQKDFKEAVQDAYNQGLETRRRVLDGSAKFYDSDDNELFLSEGIDDVYIVCVTTENLPVLPIQVRHLLSKEKIDPYPIVITVFDLELIAYYLADPYDFMYYLKQRISLTDYYLATEEITFLSYHLSNKLWKKPNVNMEALDDSIAAAIDRNYYPAKLGLKVPDTGDRIKAAWKDEDFNHLCEKLKTFKQPKITDIIFYLLDLSGTARQNLVSIMIDTKKRTQVDGKPHDFSLPPDESLQLRVGFTYATTGTDNIEILKTRLLNLCEARKYKDRGDIWVGFGSLKASNEIIDCVTLFDEKWKYDSELEEFAHGFLPGKGRQVRFGKKMGRNEKCSCGSGIKYKKCCLRFLSNSFH